MLAVDALLLVAAASGLLAVVLWVRVASSRSLHDASRLDGTEKLFERSNRRAFRAAVGATVVAVLALLAAYAAGHDIGAF